MIRATGTFQFDPTSSATEVRLVADGRPVPVPAWALSGNPGVALCQKLVLEDDAIEGDDVLLIEHRAIARLTAAEATRLDLPPVSMMRAVIEGAGAMMSSSFSITLRWTRPDGQNVLGANRVGAWLREPGGWRRLPETLFGLAEAVDAHGAAAGDDAARLSALVRIQEALPSAAMTGAAEGRGILGSVTILEADAFSLDTIGEGDAMQVVPVLHRSGGDAPLLPETQQGDLGHQFTRFPAAHAVYGLPGRIYVTLSPPLRQALEVVRRVADGSPAQRRAFLREPRAAIRAAIGDETDAALVDSLVVETAEWSDRVIGLGLWQPRVLPWIALSSNDWFGAGPDSRAATTLTQRGVIVGGRTLPLTPEAAAALAARVRQAIWDGCATVLVETDSGSLDVPATEATVNALDAMRPPGSKPTPNSEVVIIKTNETVRDIEAAVQGRPPLTFGEPACLRTKLKTHQQEGLLWLQKNWVAGAPGVLLADDMGLGKTLQGLAFLAWLRAGMESGCLARAPILIVAPTGLLENWRAEHDLHLAAPGLGTVLPAYGKGLAALRRKAADGAAILDREALRMADWVLTTYETIRDQDIDFGQVHFAAMLLDEAQKVKRPGIRLTDAAKGMNADFRIAMTGTPVENRLSDLWCIVDGVAAGYLGDLRRFSAAYESDPDPKALEALKSSLDMPLGGRPALMLRRLRADRLPELPPCTERVVSAEMAGDQLSSYEDATEQGRADQGQGRIFEALRRLRIISLWGEPANVDDDAALIAGSARLGVALGALDEIAESGERALVFINDLDLMAKLSGVLQRRYCMAAAPMTISGEMTGAARQSRVDRFQTAPRGFDVMLLSPRAGGVGLTLTRANHVIHLDRWWNPAVEDQCTGRVLRIGQDRPVTVHIPLARRPNGRPSFDENLHSLLERKRALMQTILMPPEFDAGDLATMLRESLDP